MSNQPKSSHRLEIKKSLSFLSEIGLTKLISELYGLSHSNKDFLSAKFLLTSLALENYKAKIESYLTSDKSWKESQSISLKKAKKQLNEYKEATKNQIGLIELMVYYIEFGTDFYVNLVICINSTIQALNQYLKMS